MADTNDDGYTTIDQLDPAGTLNGSEAIHGIQNEVDVKITPQQIKDFLGSSVAVVDATCNTAAATANKVVTIAGYTLNPKDILAITFTYGNSYGDSTAASKTFPNLIVNGTTLKVCDSRGNSAGKGCWNAGDRIEFRVNTAKTEVYIMSHDVRQSSDGVTITSDGSSYYNKQSVDIKLNPTVTKLTLSDICTTTEPNNCTYTIIDKICIVNIAGLTLSAGGVIATNLPKAKIRANEQFPYISGIVPIFYIDQNSTDLRCTQSCSVNVYTQIIYPIA